MRIVIVEDEIKIRNGLSRLLSAHENTEVVGKAKNGREGIELIEELRPDLVVTDIQMPEMNGLDMLDELKEKGIKCHSIILTGYAEFDYARRAVSAGADDYLLKPITVDDVERVLLTINKKIGVEAAQLDADPAIYLRTLIAGTLELSMENIQKINRVFGIHDGESMWLLYGRFPEKIVEDELGARFDDSLAMTSLDESNGLCLLYRQAVNSEEMAAMIKRRISVISSAKNSIWTLGELTDISNLTSKLDDLRKNILYAMALGDISVITKSDYEQKEFPDYPYSSEMEKEIEKILMTGDGEVFEKWCNDFTDTLKKGRYNPFSVRVAVSNISNYIMQLASRMWTRKLKPLADVDAPLKISRALLLREMLEPLKEQVRIILLRENERENIRNYTLLKAISYIREHYQEKISQEEVADYLAITPEYLSTLFHREMNINFSAFVNEFRVSHAKRLLKTTDLKIYEVAEKVGFSDTKYFNKVFKDIEGISPKEFKSMK